uniref:Uncharacterized protein n=1 Tax=Anopheles culicifacies TaxID=139723 RepID=A0A182LVG3_9DIPT
MNSLPVLNDERHFRNQRWYERMQQPQPQHEPQRQHNYQRVMPDEHDSPNDNGSRPIQRTSTPCLLEHDRRGQGRGRPRQERPGSRKFQPVGDCIETDGDMDDTLSEFAAGCYSRRRYRSRTSTMRPSTWKKLNQWLDEHQHTRTEGMEKGQSMTELRVAEYLSSEEENNGQSMMDDSERELFENVKQESEEIKKEATSARSETVPEVVESLPLKNKSIGVGYRFLKNLMMLLLYIIETILPATYPLMKFLKTHIRTALEYLWVRFYQPIMMQGSQKRDDPLSLVIMLLMLPLIALLGVTYCVVCILYWVHRLFLIESCDQL